MVDSETFRFPKLLDIRSPEYPLDREAFDLALTTGHGRTLIHAQKFGVEAFKDLILDAAIRCRYRESQFAYLPRLQCPGSVFADIQGWSLAKLCIIAGVADDLIDTPFEDEDGNYRWNAYQRERIEEELVAAGHMLPPPEWDEIHSSWPQRWKARLASDGEAGMLKVAEAFGCELLSKKVMGVWHVSDAVKCYDRLHGEGTAMRLLAPKTAHNRAILRFVRVHRRNQLRNEMVTKAEEKEARSYRPGPPATLDDVIAYIHGKEHDQFSIRQFCKSATHEERLRIQRVLYESNKPSVLRRVLNCIRENGLPEFDSSLLALMAHEDEEVRCAAGCVFRQHGQPEVRNAALSAFARGDKEMALVLLHRSARNADSRLVLRILRELWQDKDIGDPHEIFVIALQLFGDNQDLTEPLMLLFVYEHSPCRVCRSEAFRLMMERGICPDWVLEEARWDAMPGIRELATGAQPWPLSEQSQLTLITQIHTSDPTATAESLSARFGSEDRNRIERIEQIIEVLKERR